MDLWEYETLFRCVLWCLSHRGNVRVESLQRPSRSLVTLCRSYRFLSATSHTEGPVYFHCECDMTQTIHTWSLHRFFCHKHGRTPLVHVTGTRHYNNFPRKILVNSELPPEFWKPFGTTLVSTAVGPKQRGTHRVSVSSKAQ